MADQGASSRKFNPAEIVILVAVLGIFGHSVFQLLYSGDGIPSPERLVLRRSPIRTIASVSVPEEIQTVLGCSGKEEMIRVKSNVKNMTLTGDLCELTTTQVEAVVNGKTIAGAIDTMSKTYSFSGISIEDQMNVEVKFKSPIQSKSQSFKVKRN
ncbi:MAG: hypothetical protein KA715_04630 [Xanthomonadaceae bacterium]|nr:hypothetical protein [Xanthomonadaceae bacterium]